MCQYSCISYKYSRIEFIAAIFGYIAKPSTISSHFIRTKSNLFMQILECFIICFSFLSYNFSLFTHTGDYERAFGASVTINESSFVCKESFTDTRTFVGKNPTTAHGIDANDTGDELPTIYFVTPTYPRREQFAELIRLGQTLMHVPNLHWIVADDTDSCNPQIDEFLNRFGEFFVICFDCHCSWFCIVFVCVRACVFVNLIYVNFNNFVCVCEWRTATKCPK